MPGPSVLVPLAISFIMAVAVVWLAWRVVLAGGRLRMEKASAVEVAGLAADVDRSLEEVLASVDEMRRRKVAPASVQPVLETATNSLQRHIDQAVTMGRNPAWTSTSEILVADIERAQRAIDLIVHGAGLMADLPLIDAGEGETAVKRGYVNLVHARETIRERRQEILASSGARTGASGAR